MSELIRCTLQAAANLISDLDTATSEDIEGLSIETRRQIIRIVDYVQKGDATNRIEFQKINDGCLNMELKGDGKTIKATIEAKKTDETSFFENLFKRLAEFVGYAPTAEMLKQKITSCKLVSPGSKYNDL